MTRTVPLLFRSCRSCSIGVLSDVWLEVWSKCCCRWTVPCNAYTTYCHHSTVKGKKGCNQIHLLLKMATPARRQCMQPLLYVWSVRVLAVFALPFGHSEVFLALLRLPMPALPWLADVECRCIQRLSPHQSSHRWTCWGTTLSMPHISYAETDSHIIVSSSGINFNCLQKTWKFTCSKYQVWNT